MTNKIYKYEATIALSFPVTTGEETIIDLGVLEGYHYLSATDSVVFPKEFILVDLTTKKGLLIREMLRKESLVCKQINEDITRKIRERYDINEELKALRTGDTEYQSFVNGVVQEGKTRKGNFGL